MDWDEVWNAAETDQAERKQDERLGPGSYILKVTAAKETTTQKGNPRWLFTLWCEQGVAWKGVNVPYPGAKPGMARFFVDDCRKLGLTQEALAASVPNALKGVIGAVFNVELEQDGEWLNCEIGAEEPRTATLGPVERDEDQEPF